jgi:hypothetical protein
MGRGFESAESGAQTPLVYRKLEKPRDLVAMADRDTKVYSLGFQPTLDYVKTMYGDGWEERDMTPPKESPLPPGFTEPRSSRVSHTQLLHHMDQQGLVEAADALADAVGPVVESRVDDLIAQLRETGDLVTFREKLVEEMRGTPSIAVTTAVERAGLVSSLLGRLRGQRRSGR